MSIRSTSNLTIPTRFLTYWDIQVQAIVLLCAPVDALYILVLTTGGPAQNFHAKLALFIGVVVCTDLLLEGITSVRRVDIDQTGVTFRYLFHKERGTWEVLTPATQLPSHGTWFIIRATKRGSRRGHRVTVAQGKAILEFPSAPKWAVDRGILSSLGLPLN